MSTLTISNLHVAIQTESGPIDILTGVNLTLEQGSTHAIMGPNGSGKSTLMNLIGCLDRPSAGSVKISG